jgi:hypothetical protein
MPQKQVAIVGHNNTRAAVTGQEELVVKLNSVTAGASISITTTPELRVPTLVRTSTTGSITDPCYSVSVANVGSANGTFLTGQLKPNETLSFDAGAINNYFDADTITWDATGTEFIITYII